MKTDTIRIFFFFILAFAFASCGNDEEVAIGELGAGPAPAEAKQPQFVTVSDASEAPPVEWSKIGSDPNKLFPTAMVVLSTTGKPGKVLLDEGAVEAPPAGYVLVKIKTPEEMPLQYRAHFDKAVWIYAVPANLAAARK